MDIWSSINSDLDPELRDKLFSEELFMYKCPHCEEVTGIPYGFIYHNMSDKFILFFNFFKPDDYDYSPVEIPRDTLRLDGYTFREVFDLKRLKEKIVILEAGLNDVAIERMKHIMSHIAYPEIAEKGSELFFGARQKPEEKDEEDNYGSLLFFYHEEEDSYTIRVPMETYFEQCLACDLDPRMKAEAGMCIDKEWMDMQLRKEG